MSRTIVKFFGIADRVIPIFSRNQAGGYAGRIIRLVGLPMLLAGISVPSRAAYIDSFAVGPQSFYIGPGEASAGGSVSGLDTNQVAWGSRSFTIYADQKGSGFRTLDEGSILVAVGGYAPGSLNVSVNEAVMESESPYDPWIYLAYQSGGPAADWSAFNQIVINFTTPPTADLRIQTDVTSDITTWYAETLVAAGAYSASIPFSDLNPTDTAFTGSNVLYCSFSFNPPMQESFVIGDIQVTAAAMPLLPCLNAVRCEAGVTLTWTTNATRLVLQHSTNMDQSFSAVTNNPMVVGTNYSVTLPCACPAEFFCLKRSP